MNSPFMSNKKPSLGRKFGSGMDINSPLPKPDWDDDLEGSPGKLRHSSASASRMGKSNHSIFTRFGGHHNYMSNSNFTFLNKMSINKQEPKPKPAPPKSGWNPNLLKP